METSSVNINQTEDSEQVDSSHSETSPGAAQLRKWLNKTLKIEMSDGRVLIGIFLCTDRDANIILGSCSEFLPEDIESVDTCNFSTNTEEPRMLGLVMVPGKHIISICIDNRECSERQLEQSLTTEISNEEVIYLRINPTLSTKGFVAVICIENSGNKVET